MGEEPSAILTLRVPRSLDRRIVGEARRRKKTKSALVREALEEAFGGRQPETDPAAEARRQSLLVSGRESERDAMDFIEHAADDRGWR